MSTTIWRGVVVLAITFASLGLAATPASAAVLTGAVTGGTVTLVNAAGTTFDVIPVPTTVTLGTDCVNTVDITTTVTTTSVTNWNITAWQVVQRFKLGATWYVLEETRIGSAAGTVDIDRMGIALNAAALNLSFNFYLANDQSDTATSCSHGTTRRCRFANVALTLQGAYASGDIHTPATSDQVVLSGFGGLGVTSPPCVVPFTTYSAGTITVTGLVIHLI